MDTTKGLVESHHLLRVRCRIVRFLAVSGLLVLALTHDSGGCWADDEKIECTSCENGDQWHQHGRAKSRVEECGEAGAGWVGEGEMGWDRVGQRHDDGEGGLETEVDWEKSGLES